MVGPIPLVGRSWDRSMLARLALSWTCGSIPSWCGGRWDRAHWVSRVIDVDPGRRLVLESIRGDFRGTIRLLLDPVGANAVHVSLRFLGDPAGS
jgi:hypothetical protein